MAAQLHVINTKTVNKSVKNLQFEFSKTPPVRPDQLSFTGRDTHGHIKLWQAMQLTNDWQADAYRGKAFAGEYLNWVLNSKSVGVEPGILGVIALRMFQQKTDAMEPLIIGFFGLIGDLLKDGEL